MGKRFKSGSQVFHVTGCIVWWDRFCQWRIGSRSCPGLSHRDRISPCPWAIERHHASSYHEIYSFGQSGKVCECRSFHGEKDRGAGGCEGSSIGHRSCSRTSGDPPDSLSPTRLWSFQKGLSEMCRRGNEVCEALRP